jgi:hypothetical protein
MCPPPLRFCSRADYCDEVLLLQAACWGHAVSRLPYESRACCFWMFTTWSSNRHKLQRSSPSSPRRQVVVFVTMGASYEDYSLYRVLRRASHSVKALQDYVHPYMNMY